MLSDQMNTADAISALAALGYDVEQLYEHVGFTATVTVEQLAMAGVPNRLVFEARRRLDARVCLCCRFGCGQSV